MQTYSATKEYLLRLEVRYGKVNDTNLTKTEVNDPDKKTETFSVGARPTKTTADSRVHVCPTSTFQAYFPWVGGHRGRERQVKL